MGAGRPTKYKEEETIAKAKAYINGDFLMDGDVIPTEEGLAPYLGVCTSTLDNWEADYPEFLGTLRALKAKQKRILINMGLTGDFQSTIAKLMLSSNHGINEKSEVEKSGNVNNSLTIEFVDKK